MIEKGFLIYANNTWKENYLKQAYALALSIKLYNNDAHIIVCQNMYLSTQDIGKIVKKKQEP